MENFLEFEVLIVLKNEQTQKLIDMSIDPTEIRMEHKFVKYFFDP